MKLLDFKASHPTKMESKEDMGQHARHACDLCRCDKLTC